MFKDRVEAAIQQEWSAKNLAERITDEEKAKPMPKATLPFRNEVAKRLLAKEPQEVRDEVDKWRREEHTRDLKVEDGVDEEARRLKAANRYHK